MTLERLAEVRRQRGFYERLLRRLERSGADKNSPLHRAIERKLKELTQRAR